MWEYLKRCAQDPGEIDDLVDSEESPSDINGEDDDDDYYSNDDQI